MNLVANQLPRLLAGLENAESADWHVHRSVYGEFGSGLSGSGIGAGRRAGVGRAQALIAELERADLHGHGGGWFPTSRKLAAVAKAGGRPSVVVTVTESEALSGKDSLLATRLPHLLIDGAMVVADALGAGRIVIAFDESKRKTGQTLAAAVAQRASVAGREQAAIRVIGVPHRYVAGQETALVSALNGRAGLPTFTPPYPFERGIDRQPTFVANAETYAQLGLIAGHGADWYRALGTQTAPGSRLVSISGAVGKRVVVEVAGGSSIVEALSMAGGVSEEPAGFLLGGFGGTWASGDAGGRLPNLTFDEAALRKVGLTLGPGIVFVLPRSACVVAEVATVARAMAGESAGQCGPCVHGTRAIADQLEGLWSRGSASGRSRDIDPVARLAELTGLVRGRGACAHPDGVARFVGSALAAFPERFAEHAAGGRCERCESGRWLAVADTRRRGGGLERRRRGTREVVA